ncbi:hypothetical protein [Flavobacterium sp.]|uniref:tetratricopeptide repeat protein n=1 Tax=Flavobacterium sp. TaxID=239 RepID=UPI00248988C2|nr:hypothetical protein [Flavobacterium sp.]MDI1317004.1 hypothetical protein [Flavobacterium sp.]
MKNHTQILVVLASVFSLSCFSQRTERFPANAKMSSEQTINSTTLRSDLAVVSYHVEERVNRPMGSSITTYTVSSLSLVATNDLGENNSRVITPIYGKPKVEALTALIPVLKNKSSVKLSEVPTSILSSGNIMKSIDVADTNEATPTIIETKPKNVKIDILATYERIMDKGYKNVDMITKVGNSHFFAGDLVLAAKWYAELFAVKTDLEPVYYYRYAQSLKAVKQFEKANAMMKIFETMSL